MALILNIETSTEVCSVALARDGETIAIKKNSEGLNHSKFLSTYIENVFKEINLEYSGIDAVAVSKGPGSYTGLRIGTSVAKGLCYALDKPLISICSLDILGKYAAQNLYIYSDVNELESLLLCPMSDARRMEVFLAVYNSAGNQISPVSAEIIDEHSFSEFFSSHKIMFFGNGAQKCLNHLNHPNALFSGPEKTSAQFMQKLAEEKYNNNEFENVAYFEPFYLKDFITTIPKNKIIQ